ncbi:MAG: hypothetical protein IR153_02715 [Flavobacterium sp.]|nr:hypothetical protein [Flavobacterium sp.]
MTDNPNKSEFQFLTLAYNRFYDIYDEVMNESFWGKDEWERFSKIKQAFSIYAELLNYEPLKCVIEKLKTERPPMESEIGSELLKFVRNVVAHFPFFKSWDEVYINNSLVNWYKEGQTIDKFLKKYEGHKEVKYRFWEPAKKKMTYLTISFPKEYLIDTKIFLKDIISEQEGIKFSFILMKQIMNTQVEELIINQFNKYRNDLF